MSKTDWPKIPLVRITTKIGSGATPRGGKESYKDEGVALIRSLNVYDFQFERNELAHIDDKQAKQLSNVVVQRGDILLNITGASVARCCMVPSDVLPARVNQHVAIIRIDETKAHGKFIYYCINSPRYKHQLLSLAQGGATREALTKQTIEDFEVPLADLSTQRRIAYILSAYDDLIENNTRRIAILEEMARRIYEEWFVRFRFPGHEQLKMVESELGLIPEGWSTCRLDDVLVLQRGFDLPRQVRTEGSFPIISATGESGTHKEYRVNGPGVVTGRSGSLGTVMYVERDFWPLNTTLWVKEFKVGSPLYAFYVLQSIDLVGFNSGAAVPTLNRNDVHGLPVFKPASDVLLHFDATAGPMLALKLRLEQKNANLRTTRDLLLPKLISGELDVSTLPEPEEALAA